MPKRNPQSSFLTPTEKPTDRQIISAYRADITNKITALIQAALKGRGVTLYGRDEMDLWTGTAALAREYGLSTRDGSPLSNIVNEAWQNAKNPNFAWIAVQKAAREEVDAKKNPPMTDSFKRWFGDSQIRHANGQPKVVYHGTGDIFTAFDLDHPNRKDTGWLGTGVYLTTDPSIASAYSALKTGGGHPNVMPLYAKVERPYDATLEEKQHLQLISRNEGAAAGRSAADAWTRELKSQGYDGVILRYKAEQVGKQHASTEIVVFDPAGVKSAIGNRGTFDPSDPSIENPPLKSILKHVGRKGIPWAPGGTAFEIWSEAFELDGRLKELRRTIDRLADQYIGEEDQRRRAVLQYFERTKLQYRPTIRMKVHGILTTIKPTDLGDEINELLEGKSASVRKYFRRLEPHENLNAIRVSAADDALDELKGLNLISQDADAQDVPRLLVEAAENIAPLDFWGRVDFALQEEERQAAEQGLERGPLAEAVEQYERAESSLERMGAFLEKETGFVRPKRREKGLRAAEAIAGPPAAPVAPTAPVRIVHKPIVLKKPTLPTIRKPITPLDFGGRFSFSTREAGRLADELTEKTGRWPKGMEIVPDPQDRRRWIFVQKGR